MARPPDPEPARLEGPAESPALPALLPEPVREVALQLGEPQSIILPGPDGRFRVLMPGSGYALQLDSGGPVYLPAEEGQRPQQIRPREDLRVKGVGQTIVGQPGQTVILVAKRRGE
jgi:hypothetical protein